MIEWYLFTEHEPDQYQWVIAWDAPASVPHLICYGAGWSGAVIPRGHLTHWMALPADMERGPPPACCKECGKPLTTGTSMEAQP